MNLLVRLRPAAFIAVLLVVWHIAVICQKVHLLPTPLAVARGIVELARHGLLIKYVVASLFRVTWGFVGAAILAIPFGLALGWRRRAGMALNPLIQIFRPISPLAWIPISILWFGVGDMAAIFLIFLASFLPLTVTAMNAVGNIEAQHLAAGFNFGLTKRQMLRAVVVPAILPQLVL